LRTRKGASRVREPATFEKEGNKHVPGLKIRVRKKEKKKAQERRRERKRGRKKVEHRNPSGG